MLKGRKLLVASLGVAAVSYACAKTPERPETTGNLMAPLPQPEADAGAPTTPTTPTPPEMTGNLMPPQPEPTPDAGQKPVKKVGK